MSQSERMAVSEEQKKAPGRFYESWTFLIVVCIAVPLFLRSVAYAPFHIPSGSMKPNLLVGDYLFVSKFAYGYSRYSFPLGIKFFEGRMMNTDPSRGDVIVFRMPTDTKVDYIKRLIGLPGDTVQMIEGRLYLNGRLVPKERVDDFVEEQEDGSLRRIPRYRETLPEGLAYYVLDEDSHGRLDTTPLYRVPEGHYFFMGDNRDNSQDSRVQNLVGFVPGDNLVGRAELIFFSNSGTLWKPFKWLFSFRPGRFVQAVM